ncbi:MAG: DUF2892 domain-containing protein [Candidatus Coatesbacteria bacterium]|nr:MAG: DUF2892 domain-containing protein [Candidatus Coatesbacteria bacterium]
MKVNVGIVDRVIRSFVGIAAAVVAVYLDSIWSLIPAIIAVIALVTAISARCGLYTLFGINTRKVK